MEAPLLLVIHFGQVGVPLSEYALKIGDGFADFRVSLRLRCGQDHHVLEELFAHLRSHRCAAAQGWVGIYLQQHWPEMWRLHVLSVRLGNVKS